MPSPVAVQVTRETTVSSCSPNMSIGWSSVRLVVFTDQPAIGVVRTDPSGWSAGRVSRTFIVLASSRSFGTRKATTENPPPSTVPGCTDTCACATPGSATVAAMAATAAPTPTRSAARRAALFLNMIRSRFVEVSELD